MAFEIDHDWQGNIATPKARIGEHVKNRLLILLCVVWICVGLLGHGPWKPDESASISIVKSMLNGNSLLAPIAVGDNLINNPPLYYLSAAGMAKALSPALLPMHDAARLVSGLWMALTLLLVGMVGRELWGLGIGRQTTFIFMSSLGLIVSAHLLTPEISALTAMAMGLYALALAKRRPFRASALLGSGMGIGFLSTGVMTPIILVATALTLLLFRAWRSRSYAIVLGLSLLVAIPWLTIWPLLAWIYTPAPFLAWWQSQLLSMDNLSHSYFLRTLAWYAWPALPIAAWGLWRYRMALLFKPRFQLILVFFVISLLIIGFTASSSEIHALPLLLPLAALAGGSVETLKRGAAGALNWFGLILFGIMGFLIWLGWVAIMTGWPAKLSERMHILSGLQQAKFSWLALGAALLVTLIWLVTINAKRSNRAAVTDWAVGITMAWSLLMTLWLPLIDSAKSYQSVMLGLQHALPTDYACINSRNLGSAQQALMEYYTGLHTLPLEIVQRLDCDLYLIRDERGSEKIEPGPDWKLLWQGKRPAERRESFRLYQHL